MKSIKNSKIFWLSLSLFFSIFYSLLTLKQAFASEYVVQDDARQHVFWMVRYIDPDLFPNDLIADYFQSVAPLGYSSFYKLFALFGIEPFFFNKLLPLVLGFVVTVYCFLVTVEILPIPMTGFIASLLLNQYLSLQDDISSGTPVAFIYPLFLAFLYYFLKHSLIPYLIASALLGLFYPQGVLIIAGILILELFLKRKDFEQSRFCLLGLGVTFIVILFYGLKSSRYGPVISAVEARTMPEFLVGGTSEFFVNSPVAYWFDGLRSGIIPFFGSPIPLIASGLLPILFLFPITFPTLKKINRKINVFWKITLASLGMFFLAHAFLFKLHLPSRYTEHTFRIITAILAAIALTAIINSLLAIIQKYGIAYGNLKSFLATILLMVVTLVLIGYPSTLKNFPKAEYITGNFPKLYEFFLQQPKDILIASLSREIDNIPSFSQRSILVGGQGYPLPYHKGYYSQIRQRTIDLITAQYSLEFEPIKKFIQKYDIDFWLVEKTAFSPEYFVDRRWILQYKQAYQNAIAHLQQNPQPKLTEFMSQCSARDIDNFVILKTQCILKQKS